MLTLDLLKRSGRVLASRCFLCGDKEETVDHLLVHCSKARLFLDLFLVIVGVNWVFPMSIREASSFDVAPLWGKNHKRT